MTEVDVEYREFKLRGSTYYVSEYGTVYSMNKKRNLSIGDNGNGYKNCNLFGGDRGNNPTKFYIHRLVATLFVPNPQQLEDVNHKDGDKSNNHYSNLEWLSHTDNMKHAYENGYFKKAHQRFIDARKKWVGERNSTREVIGVTDEKYGSCTNYLVWVRCLFCSHEFKMYMNDFRKDKCKSCSNCRYTKK